MWLLGHRKDTRSPLSDRFQYASSLCLSRYPWADFRKTKAGIKLHLRLNFHDGKVLPDEAVVTPAKQADKSQMEAIESLKTRML